MQTAGLSTATVAGMIETVSLACREGGQDFDAVFGTALPGNDMHSLPQDSWFQSNFARGSRCLCNALVITVWQH